MYSKRKVKAKTVKKATIPPACGIEDDLGQKDQRSPKSGGSLELIQEHVSQSQVIRPAKITTSRKVKADKLNFKKSPRTRSAMLTSKTDESAPTKELKTKNTIIENQTSQLSDVDVVQPTNAEKLSSQSEINSVEVYPKDIVQNVDAHNNGEIGSKVEMYRITDTQFQAEDEILFETQCTMEPLMSTHAKTIDDKGNSKQDKIKMRSAAKRKALHNSDHCDHPQVFKHKHASVEEAKKLRGDLPIDGDDDNAILDSVHPQNLDDEASQIMSSQPLYDNLRTKRYNAGLGKSFDRITSQALEVLRRRALMSKKGSTFMSLESKLSSQSQTQFGDVGTNDDIHDWLHSGLERCNFKSEDSVNVCDQDQIGKSILRNSCGSISSVSKRVRYEDRVRVRNFEVENGKRTLKKIGIKKTYSEIFHYPN